MQWIWRVGLLLVFLCCEASASVLTSVRGVVHDGQHRPIAGAEVTVEAAGSAYKQRTVTDAEGGFRFAALALGDYTVTIAQPGFARVRETLRVLSDAMPVLHYELAVGDVMDSVTVKAEAQTVDSGTPTTLVSRLDIEQTPGADRTNGLEMVTDFVPGAYVAHDMLHVRGGHQVSWQIDGVQIPNTNVASNVGAQIDPKDIDYLEVQRGSYTADVGDRTYGVFNVVPRNGFDRQRDAELVVTAGNFLGTDDQLNFGSHTERFAYYASLNGNRSDYGLAPPAGAVHHDSTNGYGGFGSLLYNRDAKDQFRLAGQVRRDFFQIPDDPDSAGSVYDSSGLRDVQHEGDGFVDGSWVRTFAHAGVLQVSPFYHWNSAGLEAGVNDSPVATNSYRRSQYVGGQGELTREIAKNTLQAGVYGYGQWDGDTLTLRFADASAGEVNSSSAIAGGLAEVFVSDSVRVRPWLNVTAGLRESHFSSGFTEDHVSPRIGVSAEVPRIHWVFRAFYGRFYQPPPLLTVTGPVIDYADEQNTAFATLHGERDEEHQFGVQIPLRGWVIDADTFETRANNFLDHSNLGESSLYYPVTVVGAKIQAWEVTVRSPEMRGLGRVHLAYSNQVAKQRGAITGGLICAPGSGCNVGFTYTPLDHDQRNSLSVGTETRLPWRSFGAVNVAYGSGLHNGTPTDQYPNDYLPGHTTADVSLGTRFGEDVRVSVNALNVLNRRVLLDNSLTFGGLHFNDPRVMYAEVRYRFHY